MVLKKKRTLTYTGTVQCTIYTVRKKNLNKKISMISTKVITTTQYYKRCNTHASACARKTEHLFDISYHPHMICYEYKRNKV